MFTSSLKFAHDTLPQVVCSDNSSHTKFEIAIYLFKVLTNLPPKTKILKVWSDGPTSQFKNKFTGALIQLFEKKFKLKIYWNFFATSHCKGCVDGLGAVAKNRVRRLVKSRQATVNCADDFVNAFNLEDSIINVIHLSDTEALKIRRQLKLDDIFDSAQSVPYIFGYHQLQVISTKVVGFCLSEEGYNVK